MYGDSQRFRMLEKLAVIYPALDVYGRVSIGCDLVAKVHTKSLTFFILLLLAVSSLSFFKLIFIHFVSFTFILSPICYIWLGHPFYSGYSYVAVLLVNLCHLQSQGLRVTVGMFGIFLCWPDWWWFLSFLWCRWSCWGCHNALRSSIMWDGVHCQMLGKINEIGIKNGVSFIALFWSLFQ